MIGLRLQEFAENPSKERKRKAKQKKDYEEISLSFVVTVIIKHLVFN